MAGHSPALLWPRAFAAAFLAGSLLAATWADSRPDSSYRPSHEWRRSTPEQQGIDSAKLAPIFEAVRTRRIPIHSLAVIRNGYLVLDAYFYPFQAGTKHDLASVTKSVMSTLTGIAVDLGRIRSIDQHISEFFPEYNFSQLEEGKRQLTVRHLLTMTSGFCPDFAAGERQLAGMRVTMDWTAYILHAPQADAPGTRFAYCSAASNLLSAVLTRATGMRSESFARAYLFGPLGIRNVIWPRDPQGNSVGWGDTYMEPLDMAKLGYLYLNEGVWGGRQVVSREWIKAATSRQVDVPDDYAYGYKWWLLKEPAGSFEARGRGGQRISVIPSRQLVIVVTGAGRFQPGDIGELLWPAVSPERRLPPNPAAFRHLQKLVAAAAQQPVERRPVHLPKCAREVSGKTLLLTDNPYGLRTLRLDFPPGAAQGRVRYSLYEPANHQSGTRETPFGLDGVDRISRSSLLHALPVAARGEWTGPQTFSLHLNMAAFNHSMHLDFEFEGAGATVRVRDDGLQEFTVKGAY